ncbi:hypothetical protein [Rhizobium sp. ZW T2_16]|uniref:hypothetical protein n=1 Tax=Rhizobium sp. ZW T2_16 TaxID=3378083 RepID=UPI0038524C13
MSQPSHDHRNALRSAHIELIESFNPNAFVTLALNKTSSVEEVTRLIGKFCGMMDRKLLGHKWHRLPASDRSDGIFFIEHTRTNIHAHGIIRFPTSDFLDLARKTILTWNCLTEAGTVDFQVITDLERLGRYCTKEMPNFLYDSDQMVLLRQFMPN